MELGPWLLPKIMGPVGVGKSFELGQMGLCPLGCKKFKGDKSVYGLITNIGFKLDSFKLG